MEKIKLFLYALLLAFLMTNEVNGYKHGSRKHGHRKLFVFGDSYADTGNLGKIGRNLARSWYEPYGMTYPNRPSGRFSDGRILTDYLASFLRIKSPVPYKYRKVSSKHPYGMNFAVAGSGVFDTGNLQRNLSAQIDTFQAQINEGVFSKHDVKSSIAYVSISGNDYAYYAEHHNVLEVFALVENVTAEMAVDLNKLREIGVEKVVVANLSPVECTPDLTRSSSNYTQCDDEYALGPTHHNELLKKAVEELNAESKNTEFLILDLYDAFMSVIKPGKGSARKFKHILRPCCEGNTEEVSCGWTGKNGENLYSLCSNPQDYFYFDSVHPTQAGWGAVFENIQPWLRRNL